MARVLTRLRDWYEDLLDSLLPCGALEEGIDVHCHLFSASTALVYLVKSVIDISDAADLSQATRALRRTSGDTGAASLATRAVALKGYIRILRAWLRPNARKLHRFLRRGEKYRFRIVPLMLDFDCQADTAALDALFERFRASANTLADRLDGLRGAPLPGFRASADRVAREISRYIDRRGPLVDFYDQADELARLAGKYDGIYPFLAFDPRRKDILDYAMEEVGPGKPFLGIKLYPAMGFSPTHPILFDRSRPGGCLYGYCEANDIPIIAHCSPRGFGSLAKSLRIDGHVFVEEGVSIKVDGSPCPEGGPSAVNGGVEFSKSVFDPATPLLAVYQEKARVLTHPRIWAVVLKEFPGLRLDLAHFGEAGEIRAWCASRRAPAMDSATSWAELIACLADEFANVYTDLAFVHDANALAELKTVLWDRGLISENVKNKVMYGSDWDVVMFQEPDIQAYVGRFAAVFGTGFRKLSVDNPQRFLFNSPATPR